MSISARREILPTASIIKAFRLKMASLTVIDYNLDNYLEKVIAALDNYPLISQRANMFTDEISYAEPVGDGTVMAKAWRMLLDGIFELYKTINMWDENGLAWSRYAGMLGDDVIIIKEYRLGNDPIVKNMLTNQETFNRFSIHG